MLDILTRAGCFVAIIVLGYLLKKFGFFPDSAFTVLSKIVIRVTLPAAIALNYAGKTFDLGKELDIDPISAALNGGEDYRLLFTIPIGKHDKFRHDFQTFDIIGHLAKPEVGAVIVTPDGVELPMKAQGWVNE